MRTMLATFAVVFLFSGCVATSVVPTSATPLRACVISCGLSGRIIFIAQHKCSAGSPRWFMDTWLIGEIADHWIGCDGPPGPDQQCHTPAEYAKADVERGTCSEVIRQIVDARDPKERGQYPGEDATGQPAAGGLHR